MRSGIDDRFSRLSGEVHQPGLRFLTQPIPNYLRHLNSCGQLFTRPTDQPRHATKTSNNPVESNSLPVSQNQPIPWSKPGWFHESPRSRLIPPPTFGRCLATKQTLEIFRESTAKAPPSLYIQYLLESKRCPVFAAFAQSARWFHSKCR